MVGELGPGAARENSGIVKSRRHPDLFWTQNAADGRRVALATYGAVWLFEPDERAESPLRGRRWRLDFEAPQVEALCFADDETLLLADETTAAPYEVKLDELSPLP